jgi:F420H(2)-dependent quinone reductase
VSRPFPVGAGDEDLCYLTTVGRSTGNPHRIEIWFALDHDRLFLLSGGRDRSDWVQNLMADSGVVVELAGWIGRGHAHLIGRDSAEDRLARDLVHDKYQPRYAGDLGPWRASSLPVIIEFDTT